MFTHQTTPGKRGTNESLLVIQADVSFTKKQKQQDQNTPTKPRNAIPLSIRHVVGSFQRVRLIVFFFFFFFFFFELLFRTLIWKACAGAFAEILCFAGMIFAAKTTRQFIKRR